jgi:hypothetical protein
MGFPRYSNQLEKQIIAAVREYKANGLKSGQIAESLNQAKIPTASGKHWTTSRIESFMFARRNRINGTKSARPKTSADRSAGTSPDALFRALLAMNARPEDKLALIELAMSL